MENPFYAVMAKKSDEELKQLATQRERFEPEAFIAIADEMQRRFLSTPEVIAEKEKAIEAIRLQSEKIEQEKAAIKENLKNPSRLLELFKPTKDYFYTPIIFYLNVLVWVLMVVTGVSAFEPSVESLINWGGNLRGLTLDGEQWRLFTSIFLHGGIIHLALNMNALLQVGHILEMNVGKHRYVICYVAMGVLASIASMTFNDNIVSVGASGAIFGLYGLFVFLLLTKNINLAPEEIKNFLSSTVVFIAYNLVFGFMKSGIDNAAHIGGLITGFILGAVYHTTIKRPELSKPISAGVIAFVILAMVTSPLFLTNEYGDFQKAIDAFVVNEEKSMWVYEKEMPKDSLFIPAYKKRLEKDGVALWEENYSLMNNLKNTPELLKERVALLKEYSLLRIKYFKAVSETVADQTPEKFTRLNEIDAELVAVIEKIKALNK